MIFVTNIFNIHKYIISDTSDTHVFSLKCTYEASNLRILPLRFIRFNTVESPGTWNRAFFCSLEKIRYRGNCEEMFE